MLVWGLATFVPHFARPQPPSMLDPGSPSMLDPGSPSMLDPGSPDVHYDAMLPELAHSLGPAYPI